MATVTIYTTTYCSYCRAAKAFLTRKGVAFEEIDVTNDPQQRAELVARTGRRTVPQIFVCSESVGGYDDLVELNRSGKLDERLAAPCR